MGYEMLRKPFLLMETVAMICKYVNGISFQSAISRQRFFMNNATYAEQSRKLARLQQITEEVMGMDSGHMSRILSQMNTFGFLREDKDRGRVYYKTDREAIRSFLELVENSIFID